jgi:hypothetical protein
MVNYTEEQGMEETTTKLYEYDIASEVYSISTEYDNNTNVGALFNFNTYTLGISGNVVVNKSVSIYPNPTSSIVNTNIGADISKIELYNTQGQLVLMNTSSKSINISNLKSGLCVLVITDKKGNTLRSKALKE